MLRSFAVAGESVSTAEIQPKADLRVTCATADYSVQNAPPSLPPSTALWCIQPFGMLEILEWQGNFGRRSHGTSRQVLHCQDLAGSQNFLIFIILHVWWLDLFGYGLSAARQSWSHLRRGGMLCLRGMLGARFGLFISRMSGRFLAAYAPLLGVDLQRPPSVFPIRRLG